jgi:hypothetical protein
MKMKGERKEKEPTFVRGITPFFRTFCDIQKDISAVFMPLVKLSKNSRDGRIAAFLNTGSQF